MDGLDDAGAVMTGGLVARELEPRTGHEDRHHLQGAECANCGAIPTGAFCQVCGQATHLHRDLIGFAHDVLHGVFHFDGKFWTTLPLLALKPGHLTRRYIDGERQKFVTPMAMFLFSVFLMFAIVSNLSGWTGPSDGFAETTTEKLDAARRKVGEAMTESRTQAAKLNRARATSIAAGGPTYRIDRDLAEIASEQRALEKAAAMLPGSDISSPKVTVTSAVGTVPAKAEVEAWLESRVEHARENPKLMLYKMKSAGYKYSWALIPLSLPFLWLMFAWRRKFGLYDHAVFATYSIAFMSLLVVMTTLLINVVGGIGQAIGWFALMLVPPIHMYKQLRHAYRLRRFSAAWRTVALIGVVTVTSTLFFLALLYLGVAD